MQVKQISKRLEEVASFVPMGARLLDVGSDHAYLPIYLIQKGQISHAIAGEVVDGPFQSALKNVREEGLEEQIEVRLANGLGALESSDAVDTLVIAGMGGRLIADILNQGVEKLSSLNRFILQPNNREEELRSWLLDHDFQIVAERILEEAGKIYEILVVEAGEQVLSVDELRFGPFLLAEKSSVFQKKWAREKDKLEYALAQIPEKNQQERFAISQKIQHIMEVLDAS